MRVFCRDAVRRSHGCNQDDLLGDGVKDGDDGRPGHDAVRQAGSVGIDVGQAFGQPHHVVAQSAEHAGGHGRQAFWQIDARGGDQVAQAVQRAAGLERELTASDGFSFGDLGLVAATTPDEVRLHRHDGIAAAPGAAFDAFEQEGVGLALSDLQIGRDRGFQIIDQPGPDDLGLTSMVGLCEGVEGWLEAHFLTLPVLAASALARASVSTPID